MSYYGGYPYHAGPAPRRPAYYAAADPYERYPAPPAAPVHPPHWANHADYPSAPAAAARPESYVPLIPPNYFYVAPDLDREEEAARAHLKRIQERREAARLAAERERAELAERAEYEAFVAARQAAARQAKEVAVKQEIARQAAARQARDEARAARRLQAEKEALAAAARAAKQAEQEKQDRIRQAYERQLQAQHLAAQQQIQFRQILEQQQQQQQKRAAEAARAQQAAQQQAAKQAAQQAAQARAIQQFLARQAQAQAQAQARAACPRAPTPSTHPLLALFGHQNEPQAACQRSVAPSPQRAASPKIVKPASKPASKPVTPATSTPTKKENEESAFPGDLNNLLSHFLGLRVEPTTESAPSAPVADEKHDSKDVIEGLNKFLGQFGLEFEQDKPATTAAPADKPAEAAPAPSASATQTKLATPAEPASKPSTSQPDQAEKHAFESLPDFLKYAFEMAMTDGQQPACQRGESSCCQPKPAKVDKGKGVAEGEKKAKPASAVPTPASASAPVSTPQPEPKAASPADNISKLMSIATEFALARDSFNFPERLVFGPTSSDPQHPPALLFNKTNSPYHAQTNKLLQLLLAADDISSDGDKDVRQERKALVKQVEREIELLEQKRDKLWEEVRAQRERGDEEEHEVESISSGSSVVDPVEHAETVKAEEQHEAVESDGEIVEAPVESASATATESADVTTSTEPAAETVEASDEVKGFEVPITAAQPTVEPAKSYAAAVVDTAKEQEHAVKAEAKADDKSATEEEKKSDSEEKPAQTTTTTERRRSFQATVEEVKDKDEFELL